MYKYFSILIIFFYTGCTFQPTEPLHVKNLEKTITSIGSSIDRGEAKELSLKSMIISSKLAKKYDLVKPPLYHNFLVNIGVKNRGLCWHFAYDMLSQIKALDLKTFDYYIGGANINDYWEEHNTLVITCKGCKFDEGVVLDPWRNSGTLYFSKVKDDINYNWIQRGGLRN